MSRELFAKKRVEIVVERPIVSMTTALLERHGVRIYTASRAIEGLGDDGPWQSEGQPGPAGQMVTVVAIVSEDAMSALLDDLYDQLKTYRGYAAISDCQVLRAEKF